MGQPIAFVFCFCFALCLFFFAFYFVQFDELLSSPFVKCAAHTILVSLTRMHAQLHCTAGEYVRVEYVVCVCVPFDGQQFVKVVVIEFRVLPASASEQATVWESDAVVRCWRIGKQ